MGVFIGKNSADSGMSGRWFAQAEMLGGMEDHTGRVVDPVLDALGRYPDGATLSDIQAAAAGAAGALDGADAPVRDCLLTFDPDLEHARFALPEAEHPAMVERLRERLERLVGTR